MDPQQISNIIIKSEDQLSSQQFNRIKLETLDSPIDATEYSLGSTNQPSSIVLNDLDSYEIFLINKLRSYNPTLRSKVQELFNEIIFNADTGACNKRDNVPISSSIDNISPEYVEIQPQQPHKYFIKEENDSRIVDDDDVSDVSCQFQNSPELASTKSAGPSFEQHSKQYCEQRSDTKGSRKEVGALATHEGPSQSYLTPSAELPMSIKEEIFIEENEMEDVNEEDHLFTESSAYESSPLKIACRSMEYPLETISVKEELP